MFQTTNLKVFSLGIFGWQIQWFKDTPREFKQQWCLMRLKTGIGRSGSETRKKNGEFDIESNGSNQQTVQGYPLLNAYMRLQNKVKTHKKTNKHISFLQGKTHYLDWAIVNSKLLVIIYMSLPEGSLWQSGLASEQKTIRINRSRSCRVGGSSKSLWEISDIITPNAQKRNILSHRFSMI